MSLNTILATAPLTATGYHLKATGTALGQSLIWDNGTNVGIGNTNTSYTLDVSGTGRFTSTLLVSGAATFSSTVTSASSFNVLKDGSDTGFSGPFLGVSNAANNVTWGWQLGASNQLALFSYASSTIKNPLNITITGNVGIGVTPSAWYTGYTAMQLGASASIYGNKTTADTNTTQLANNAYLNTGATNWQYINADEATRYEQVNGEHNFYSVVSGSGNITWGTSKMTINSAGNVGIGRTSPFNPNNYDSNRRFLSIQATTGGVDRGAYLELIGTAGGSPDYWLGRIAFASTTTTANNHAEINCLTDSGGSYSGSLIFSTTANASTTGVGERMRITSGGSVIVQSVRNNTFASSGNLQIFDNTNNIGWGFQNNTFNNLVVFSYNGVWNTVGYFTNGTGVYVALSDANKKKDFEVSTIGLKEVLQLKPTLYRMKSEDETTDKHLGFIAQEVKDLIPQAYNQNGQDGDDDIFIGLTEMPIIAALTKAIQEMNTKLDEQNQTIQNLQEQINILAK